MQCEEAQQIICERFDGGEELTSGLDGHLVDCASCRDLVEELTSLERAFAPIPVEPYTPGFQARIKQAVQTEGGRWSTPYWAAAAMAVVYLGALVLNWMLPVAPRMYAFWQEVEGFFVGEPWVPPGPPAHDMIAMLWAEGATFATTVSSQSPISVWILIGVAATAFIAFNSFEAMQLRWETRMKLAKGQD